MSVVVFKIIFAVRFTLLYFCLLVRLAGLFKGYYEGRLQALFIQNCRVKVATMQIFYADFF